MSENLPKTGEERPLRRTSRLSVLKPHPIVENEKVPVEEEEEEENQVEDPPELYRSGDIVWHRVAGNPWWPALIYGCFYEDFLSSRVLKYGAKWKRRSYFVYFFGPSFEYVWTQTNQTLPYEGLDGFIRHAEEQVEKATTRGEQEALANRFELKVSARLRPQWDQAVEDADNALKLSPEERIKNFEEILQTILNGTKSKEKRRDSSAGRRRSSTSSNENSVKRIRTNSSLSSSKASPSFLHLGVPNLTIYDEKRLIQTLLDRPDRDELTLNEAQAIVCQLVTEMIKENSHLDMSCVQIDWFYDLLIKYSSMIRPFSRWFQDKLDTSFKDSLYIKQSQLKNLLKID